MNTKTLGNRIRDARIKAGLTQAQLAAKVGLTTIQTIGGYEAGRQLPPLSRLASIAQVTGLPIEFFVSDSKDPTRAGLEALVLHQQRTIEQFIEAQRQSGNVIEVAAEDFVMVPVVCCVAAGDSTPAEQDIEEYLPVSKDDIPAGCTPFFVRVVGDCMAHTAGLQEGDVLFVARGLEANDGDLVVVTVDGAAKVRRLARMGKQLVLVSDDPDEPVSPASEIEIAGPVLWSWSRSYHNRR